MNRILTTLALALLLSSSVQAKDEADFVDQPAVNTITNYLFGYASVSLECGDHKSYAAMFARLRQVLIIAEKRNALLWDGRTLLENTVHMIKNGADEYRRAPYVTCAEARTYIPRIKEQVDPFLEANS